MSAASARAIASHRNAATHEGLERAVAWSRQWSAEFPFCLANHLPMVLVALHRMGASDERLEAYCQIYHRQNGLVPVPEPIGAITRDNWREFFGHREREADYRTFFAGEVARLGATPSRPALSAAAHAGHCGERHARVHAHGLCDDDRQRRGDRSRPRLLGRDLPFTRRPRKVSRPRPTIRPRSSPSCMGRRRSGMSSPSAISCGTSCARSSEKPEFAHRRRYAGDRARDP